MPTSTAIVTRMLPIRGKKYEMGRDEIRRTAVYTMLKLEVALALLFGLTNTVTVLASDTFGIRNVTKKSKGPVTLASIVSAPAKNTAGELWREKNVEAARRGSVTLVSRMRTFEPARGILDGENDTTDGRNGGRT